ncbi:Outer membrane protein beta-barrel domain-containing protein [Parapedobacter composti]|uniref:Outer membrane protein beta-barrel domain-containing protein n=1 Tax=Parapedobacter composti TaxID=623281 RepID=A0A1I1EHJ7_9SPHI|nr:outer membrane beta-barrel protein [Parapedobacter composti]SFB86146.1 Outer membrane protein beta-barrel domain-containing protein [Parapedobacter composti]
MKKLVLAIAMVSISIGAFAQGQPMGFGLKAGVNFPKYHWSGSNNNYETNAATNFHVTAFLDAPIATDWFYIQPGVSLQGKGAKFVDTDNLEVTQNTMWIEVPVNFVAKFPVQTAGSFFLGAGPYVAFGISGKNRYDTNWGAEEREFEFDQDGTIKGTDFGLNFIGGFQLNNGLMIHGGYGMGITDIRGSNNNFFTGDEKLTNRVWTIGLGFAF